MNRKTTDKYGGFDEEPYEVNITRSSQSICVCIIQGNFMWERINYRSTVYYIHLPNIIERFFGVTLQSKIDKITKKLQKICDKLNRENTVLKELID